MPEGSRIFEAIQREKRETLGPDHEQRVAVAREAIELLQAAQDHPDRRMLEATRTSLMHVMNGAGGSYDILHGRLRTLWDMIDGYLGHPEDRER